MANLILYKLCTGKDTKQPDVSQEEEFIFIGEYNGHMYFSVSPTVDLTNYKNYKKLTKKELDDKTLQDALATIYNDEHDMAHLYGIGLYTADRIAEKVDELITQAITVKLKPEHQRNVMSQILGILVKKVIFAQEITADDQILIQHAMEDMALVSKIQSNGAKLVEKILAATWPELSEMNISYELLYEGI